MDGRVLVVVNPKRASALMAWIAACLAWAPGCHQSANHAALRSATTTHPEGASAAQKRLPGTQGDEEVAPRADETYVVLVFFSPACHCLTAHDERLRELALAYRDRGVRFLGIDSESTGTLERDREEATKRGYPFPIALDRGARLAHTLGAEFAGQIVVIGREGNVHYSGAIDSDRVHLTERRTQYLKNALDALVAGNKPSETETEALGCALRTW